ncbi:MAG: hypothetical protein ACOYJL_04315 [Tractidigestivibacter sp.]|jgi:hypothetical protein|uniref:hypothetical protein n=1 Tax=Tractidigestivibacter sp. TaxID=2847320 RepID=UPI003D8A9B73
MELDNPEDDRELYEEIRQAQQLTDEEREEADRLNEEAWEDNRKCEDAVLDAYEIALSRYELEDLLSWMRDELSWENVSVTRALNVYEGELADKRKALAAEMVEQASQLSRFDWHNDVAEDSWGPTDPDDIERFWGFIGYDLGDPFDDDLRTWLESLAYCLLCCVDPDPIRMPYRSPDALPITKVEEPDTLRDTMSAFVEALLAILGMDEKDVHTLEVLEEGAGKDIPNTPAWLMLDKPEAVSPYPLDMLGNDMDQNYFQARLREELGGRADILDATVPEAVVDLDLAYQRLSGKKASSLHEDQDRPALNSERERLLAAISRAEEKTDDYQGHPWDVEDEEPSEEKLDDGTNWDCSEDFGEFVEPPEAYDPFGIETHETDWSRFYGAGDEYCKAYETFRKGWKKRLSKGLPDNHEMLVTEGAKVVLKKHGLNLSGESRLVRALTERVRSDITSLRLSANAQADKTGR